MKLTLLTINKTIASQSSTFANDVTKQLEAHAVSFFANLKNKANIFSFNFVSQVNLVIQVLKNIP